MNFGCYVLGDSGIATTASVLAAIASALAAIIMLWIAIYTVRRTLWMSAVVALEQRFSQINHAKIINHDAWDSILNDKDDLSEMAKHLVFETFQFYHQAFVLRKRGALAAEDYSQWNDRLGTDLKEFHSYRSWWISDQKKFHDSWDDDFVLHVNKLVELYGFSSKTNR